MKMRTHKHALARGKDVEADDKLGEGWEYH